MQDGPKAVWIIPYVSVAFLPSLKHNFIAYRSSKMSSRPDCIFQIQQKWQSGFSWVYFNSCWSCSFESEIIKIGQSSHKMYSNNSDSSRVYKFKCLYNKSLETYWSHLVYFRALGFSSFSLGTACHKAINSSKYSFDNVRKFNFSPSVVMIRIFPFEWDVLLFDRYELFISLCAIFRPNVPLRSRL